MSPRAGRPVTRGPFRSHYYDAGPWRGTGVSFCRASCGRFTDLPAGEWPTCRACQTERVRRERWHEERAARPLNETCGEEEIRP